MLNEQTVIYRITPEDDGQTIKSFLRNKKGISRKLLVKLKQARSIFLNDRYTYLDHPVHPGDVITLVMSEEESEHIVPQPLPLDIVFEDSDILVLNKPPGQCVHPTMLHPDGTLANGVVYYWKQQGFNRKFRPVNRLDKNTSGLLIVAKNQFAHQQLAIGQRKHQIFRTYEAVVHGVLERAEGTIDAPIARRSQSLIEREVREDGQSAVTHYQVIRTFQEASHIRLRLETGRTHQIRVHMSHMGHPLFGDDLYGGSVERIQRQALHACELSFEHPRSKQRMSFFAELPEDIQRLLAELENG